MYIKVAPLHACAVSRADTWNLGSRKQDHFQVNRFKRKCSTSASFARRSQQHIELIKTCYPFKNYQRRLVQLKTNSFLHFVLPSGA